MEFVECDYCWISGSFELKIGFVSLEVAWIHEDIKLI